MAAFFNEHLSINEHRSRPSPADTGIDAVDESPRTHASPPGSAAAHPHVWYCRFSHAPHPVLDTVPGSWRGDTWPSDRTRFSHLDLPDQPTYRVRPDVGIAAWISCAGHLPYGQPDDQRFDDAASMTWDFTMTEPLEIAGHVRLRAEVTATCPHPILAVRLCDVARDGTSTLVTRGTMLIQATGDVEMELEATAWRWLPGRTLRICVAGADWPNVVAPAGPGTLTVRGARLTLPVYVPDESSAVIQFASGHEHASEDSTDTTWRIERDVPGGITRAVVGSKANYLTPFGSASERYDGWVSVNTATFEQRAHSDVEFTLNFPQVTATARGVMDLRTHDDEYQVSIRLSVRD
ncbi:MAG: CocE/NonD family hydrolase C-terminal non-catalytic domain-containing protein, partial [Actinomycetales bacterium]